MMHIFTSQVRKDELMNNTLRAVALLVLGLVAMGNAGADAETGQWYLTGMASYIDDDEDRAVDDGIAGGQGGFGWAFAENWNIEGYFARAVPGGFNAQTQLSSGLDLQLVFARESAFTPYLFAGLGYMSVNPDVGSTEQGETYSAGVGFLASVFGESPVTLRLEYRHRKDEVFANRLGDDIVSLGLHIPIGRRSAPVPVPATPPTPPPDPDTDGDGVPDSRDRCANTPAGVTVGSDGCPQDSDEDGVPDDRDSCPNTVAGAAVDENGCELDTDGDGVVDREDRCPNTTEGVQIDVNGCEIREEIDLPGVTFETNSDRLLPGAENVLDDAAETLRRNPSISVEVAGHTDSDGAAEYNESLSERRAMTVRDYLAERGVEADRLTVRGYGEANPVADNSTAAGKAENRRVVLRITER